MFTFIKSVFWIIKKNWYKYILELFFGITLAIVSLFPTIIIGNLVDEIKGDETIISFKDDTKNNSKSYFVYDGDNNINGVLFENIVDLDGSIEFNTDSRITFTNEEKITLDFNFKSDNNELEVYQDGKLVKGKNNRFTIEKGEIEIKDFYDMFAIFFVILRQ